MSYSRLAQCPKAGVLPAHRYHQLLSDTTVVVFAGRIGYIYEGTRLRYNGLMNDVRQAHGRGTSFYDDGSVEFVGEFAFGLRHGDGVEFFPDGTTRIEGPWRSGALHGPAKVWRKDGTLLMSGNFEDGFASGLAVGYYLDGTSPLYMGEMCHGQEHGHGRTFRSDGSVFYEGEFARGRPTGVGTAFFPDGTTPCYRGDMADGYADGPGTAFYSNGATSYVGAWRQGRRCGFGTQYAADGTLCYAGQWFGNEPSGRGQQFWPENGSVQYDGEWLRGRPNGFGKIFSRHVKHLSCEGEWRDGVMHGMMTVYNLEGKRGFYGSFANGRQDGWGRTFAPDGVTVVYEGPCVAMRPHGVGLYFDPLPRRSKWTHGVEDETAQETVGSRRKRLRDEDASAEESVPRCVSCLDTLDHGKASSVYTDCGHRVLCGSCADQAVARHDTWRTQCPLCRTSGQRLVPVFHA